MCNRTQELLQQEYGTLMALIEQNQQQAFFILNAQKETLKLQLHQLHEDAQNYQSKSAAMIEYVKQLGSKQESEKPASLLVNNQFAQSVSIYCTSNTSGQH